MTCTNPYPRYVSLQDSAACLVTEAEIIAVASHERFARKKGDVAFLSYAL